MTSMPIGSARAATTAIVCGWVSASTKNARAACLVERRISVIASAAAVDSSSIDALAMLHPGQVRDHRLEVEERLEPPLADLGLVRRVGRVPGRVLEHVAQDHAGGVGAVVAGADQRGDHLVAVGERPQRGEDLGLRAGVGQLERLVGADGLGHRLVDELVERGNAEDAQHPLDVRRARTEVPVGEGGGGGGVGHRGLPRGSMAWIPRCRLLLQRRLTPVVLWPERFRGGCTFGARPTGREPVAGTLPQGIVSRARLARSIPAAEPSVGGTHGPR